MRYCVGRNAIETKNLDVIPPENPSNRLKALLLINLFTERVCNASNCGDNCVRWILAIAKKHDTAIGLYRLTDFGGRRFAAKVAPTLAKRFAPWMSWCLAQRTQRNFYSDLRLWRIVGI